MNRIQAKILPLMDQIQWMMENNEHLKEPDKVLSLMDSVSIYFAHMSDEDRDYLHAVQDVVEEGRIWNKNI
jgi:hypothetical protein